VHLLEVLLTLKQRAYFSHYTAMRLHDLTEQLPGTIYLNHEQRPQPKSTHLEQGSIDSAFKRRARESQNAIEFGDIRICITNGMHTNQLGVIEERLTYGSEGKAHVRLTSVERTLIDIAVRPVYAGGVKEVLKAFSLAKQRANVTLIAQMLRQLDYVYPYHQAIGYYLDRAGYPAEDVDLFRRQKMDFDFYLAHLMDETRYVNDWRLHVPKHFV
jgi:predicted transcriptional regulator of viral defense system